MLSSAFVWECREIVLTSLRSYRRTSTCDISFRDGASSLASQISVKTEKVELAGKPSGSTRLLEGSDDR